MLVDSMFVKICGTTTLADAELALAHGADALGFIFAPSKRQVNAAQVAAIASRLHDGWPAAVDRVGVFTGANAFEIARTVRAAQLTAVQLHKRRDPQLLEQLRAEFGSSLGLWQVVNFEIEPADEAAAAERFVEELRASSFDARIAMTLVDTSQGGHSGGLGRGFPWEKAAPLIARARETGGAEEDSASRVRPASLMIAGGLRPENVAEAIGVLQPFGVDCVSGVEAAPGRKDPERLAAFLRAAGKGRFRSRDESDERD